MDVSNSTAPLEVEKYMDLSLKGIKKEAESTLSTTEAEQISVLRSAINRKLKGGERLDAEGYLEDALESIRKGKSLTIIADKVPECLEEILEENDLTVDDVLLKLKKHSSSLSTSSVIVNLNMTVLTTEQVIESLGMHDQEDSNEYLDKMMRQIQSGNYDSDELASIAPFSLTSALTEQGLEISDIISQVSNMYASYTKSVDYSAVLFSKIKPKTTILD